MKIPSIFAKRYSEKDLRKKILRHVYVAKDRAFLEDLFKPGKDGTYGMDLGPEASEEIELRLKLLAKAIKANRGVVSLPKLILLTVVLGGVAGGYYFFRNRLIENALEAGLKAVFEAQADVRGLDFDLFRARLTWETLEVANRDKPMKNLFELGPAKADLLMAGLLKGRFVVENLEVLDIRWNTDRKTSGALLDSAAETKTQGPGIAETVSSSFMSALSSFDPQAILDKEYDKLKTVKTAERLKGELESLKNDWSRRIADSRREIEETGSSVKEIASVNVAAIRNPEEALSLYHRVNGLIPKVQSLSSSAEVLQRDFGASLKILEQAKREIEKAAGEDYAYVESLVNISGEDAASLAKGLFAGYAEKNLGALYTYGKRGIEIAGNLAEGEKKEENPKGSLRSRGKNIPFPFRGELPKLWIRRMSVSAAGSGGFFEGKAENISGDPDLIGKPAEFSFSHTPSGMAFSVQGVLDGRRNAVASAKMDITATNLPLHIELPAPILTIKSLRGPLATKASLTIPRQGGMRGTARGEVASPGVERSGRTDAVSDLASSVVTGASALDVAAEYEISPKGNVDLRISSSLDKVIRDKFRDFLKDQEKKYRALLKEELKKRLEGLLAENETLRAGFGELEKAAGGNLTDIGAYKKTAEDKKRELERRLEELKKQAADALLKEAQKIAPSLPSAPALPKSLPPVPKF